MLTRGRDVAEPSYLSRAWADHKYAVPFEVFYAFVIGAVLLAFQFHLDGQRADRQEVLANLQFVRETARDNPDGVKNFQGLNLRGADLSGLDLGCTMEPTSLGLNLSDRVGEAVIRPRGPALQRENERTCADFSGADLTGVTLNRTDLTGAHFVGAKLVDVEGYAVTAPGLIVVASEVRDVRFTYSDLRGGTFSSSAVTGIPAVHTAVDSDGPAVTISRSYVSGLHVKGYDTKIDRGIWGLGSNRAHHVGDSIMSDFMKALCPVPRTEDAFGRYCPPSDSPAREGRSDIPKP